MRSYGFLEVALIIIIAILLVALLWGWNVDV